MERILIVRLGAMGDILHALPAVAALHAAGDCSINWAVEPRWDSLLSSRDADGGAPAGTDAKPIVYQPLWFDTKKIRRNFFAMRHTLYRNREQNRRFLPTITIDLQGLVKSAVIARFLGADKIVGSAHPRESIARFAYDQRVTTRSLHVIDQAYEIVQAALGKPLPALPKDKNDRLPRMREDEEWAEKIVASTRIAILNPTAGWTAKQWPADRYGALAQRLAKRGFRVLVNLGPVDEEIGAAVIDASGGSAETISCTIPQLIALTRRTSLFVGGDTGPMHLAAMLGVPTIAIFGPTDPARNGPYYERTAVVRNPLSQTSYSHVDRPDPGLMAITVDEVMVAAEKVLA